MNPRKCDDMSFNFEEHGSGVPLIFSHGLGGNLTLMRELIGPLEGVRVICYDNRGHGRTSAASDPSKLTFASMADDMAAVLDRLGIDSAVIGGESMGAGISLAFWRCHPRRVRALILGRPAWLNTSYPPNLAILAAIAKLIHEFGRGEAPARFAQSDAFKQLNASYPETARSLMRSLQDATNPDLAAVYETIPASVPFASFEELRSINAPCLLVASQDDPLHPFDYARRLAEVIPGATLQEMTSKNHSVDEYRRDFRHHISKFIHSLHMQ
jgi:pimeloyl-ACP methyl ester carboxylesterase